VSGMDAGDVLMIVEKAYAIEQPTEVWALEMLRAADRAVGAGIGAFACVYDELPDGRLGIDAASVVSLGINDDMVKAIVAQHANAPPGWLTSHFAHGQGAARCLLTSELEGQHQVENRDELEARGVHDGVNIAATDLNDRGFLMSLAVPRGFQMDPGTRENLTRVATHVLAAIRLRARLAVASPEAVLSPAGSLLHGECEARLAESGRALAKAVKTIERARGPLRSDARRALGGWKGLASARWTLVDKFELNGERYVVARENKHHTRPRGPSTLTETERTVVASAARGHTTKEIAYALGISDATVRVLLMRAARRYGARNRKELLELWVRSASGDA